MGKTGLRRVRALLAAGCLVALIGFWAPASPCRAAGEGEKSLAPSLGFTVVGELPHDSLAFTQGLVFEDGVFYESTGLNGRSSVRRVDPATGRVLARFNLEAQYFGEGLALVHGRLIQLTWRSGKAFVYDASSLRRVQELPYAAEGWGLASTPRGLVSSDGSATLTWRDVHTLQPLGTLAVTDGGKPVADLNELEWVEGWILANEWHEDRIAVIAPDSGRVKAWIDCSALRAKLGPLEPEAVLNGIAYDADAKILYVTGKLWPKIFQVRLADLPRQ